MRALFARGALRDRALATALLLVAGRAASVLLQIVAIRALTALIPSSEVGRYYLLVTAQAWAALILIAPPTAYLSRHLLEWRQRNAHRHALSLYSRYAAAVVVLSLPLFVLAIRHGYLSTPSALRTSVVLVLSLAAITASGLVATVLNLLERRAAAVAVAVASSALGIGCAVAAMRFADERSAEVWAFGLAAGNAIAALAGLAAIPGDGGAGTRVSWTPSEVWRFCWPVAAITALFWVQSQSYRRVLLVTSGAEALARFAIAYVVVATAAAAVESVLQQWVLPPFYNRIANQTIERIDDVWQEYFAALMPLLIPFFAFLTTASPFLLRLIVAPGFQTLPMVAVLAGIAESFRIVNGLVYQGGIARRNTQEMIVPNAPGALATPLLVYVASLHFGLHGAAAAVALSYVVVFASFRLTVQPRIFSRLSWRDAALSLAFALAIVVVCAAGWRLGGDAPGAVLTVAAGGTLCLFAGLVALPRLLPLMQGADR